jgi:hypothetical protein
MASPSQDPSDLADSTTAGQPAVALRLLLAAAVLLAGLAVASPGGLSAEPPPEGRCAVPIADAVEGGPAGVIVLPPGHPPIRGVGPQGQPIVTLPPGHPPIDGRLRGLPVPLQVRPPSPVFAPPVTVDL